ncbi:ABC transporter ATP-binding protein [Sulfuriferula thiophila]|uniref:ABC transporter ATP-binding protein n=1 Tax=Sulfuriferula thiophila TaxID=1781211 RepID=UPI001CB92ACA|nr:ABC transporter ATP-binding protein [Sulfuriferula thiophila]
MKPVEMVEPATGALELEIMGMSKRFGDVAALDDVNLHIPAGGFHALLGENGAGKSTLVKCLVGFYTADKGTVLVDDREVQIANPKDASQLGIGMVYQHFTLVPSMTVAENLVVARGALSAFINWHEERARLSDFMATLPFKIALDKPAGSLAAGEKQKVEIIKQLYLQRRLLILDEPTSVLTPDEADEVLGLVGDLARQKLLTVLIITHKFREVTAYADAVTVLRRGRFAGSGVLPELTIEHMAEMMVGSPVAQDVAPRPQRSAVADLPPRLVIDKLHAQGDNGLPVLRGVDLNVRSGEILGIAGVSGNGQKALVEVLTGQRDKTDGTVQVNGSPYSGRRNEQSRNKVYSLPEEPLRNACVAGLSVAHNMSLRNYDRPPLARWGWISQRAMRKQANAYVETFRVKTPGIDARIQTLSGGNVQRAVLARELSHPVELLIVANPVFGLDFNAVAETHARLLAARNAGAAVLLVSEDLDELLELADRIAVMSDGRIVFETSAETANVRELGHYMAGGHEETEVMS